MAGEGDAAALEPRPSARGEEGCAGGGKCAGPASGRRGTGRDGARGSLRVVSVSAWRGQGARALASALSENMPGGGGGGAVGRTHARARCLLADAHPFPLTGFPSCSAALLQEGKGRASV